MTAPGPVTTATPAGSIYDLGYRHYEGKRNGRVYAMWSLFVESFRGVWGFGRPMTAKAAPFILLALYAFAAFIQLAFSSIIFQSISQPGASTEGLFTYANYYSRLGILVLFFCVAQAPEVVCRDQRYQVLPLYFTRAMGRIEYALARLAALVLALFLVLLLPVVALFVGDVLMKPDTFQAIGSEWPQALPSVPGDALVALGMASLSLAISSFSPRRAYSAIGIVAYVLLMEAIPAAINSVGETAGWTWSDKLFAFSPITSLEGALSWFFGRSLDPESFTGTLTSGDFVVAAIAGAAVATAVLCFRYRRMSA
jgi:ABC-2 type transport system permease protein